MQDLYNDLNFSAESANWQIPEIAPPAPTQAPLSPTEYFWLGLGRWGEISIYFGIGLSASLLMRLLPSLAAAGAILGGGAIACTTLLMMGADTEQERLAYQLGLAAAATAILAGYWDALISLAQAAMLWIALNIWWVAAMVAIFAALELIRRK